MTVVEVESVARGRVPDLLVSSGVVESEAQADVLSSATGVVLSVHQDEGDAVHRGDLLAVIDNASLDASADRARAELEQARDDLERTRELAGRGAVSEREVIDAQRRLEAARTSAREASRTLGHTRLVAPFDGLVAVREIRVGELASSTTRAFQIVDPDRLRVIVSLPERELSRVAIGQSARLVSAYDDEVWAPGEVMRIAPVVDSSSGTFRVTVGLDAEQTSLKPGQYVSVELEVDQHEDVLVVSRDGVVYEDGLPVVYRMIPKPEEVSDEEAEPSGEDGGSWSLAKLFGGQGSAGDGVEDSKGDTGQDPGPEFVAERIRVELGLSDAERHEVVRGIEEGDRVIVVGQSNLKDGGPVRTPELSVVREGTDHEDGDEDAE